MALADYLTGTGGEYGGGRSPSLDTSDTSDLSSSDVFGSGFNTAYSASPDISTTDLSGLGGQDLFNPSSSNVTSQYDLTNVGGGNLTNPSTATGIDTGGLGNLNPSLYEGAGSSYPGQTPAYGTSSVPSWLSGLGSGISNAVGGWSGLGSTLASAAPYAAIAGIGLSQAKSAQEQNQAYAKQLADLGGPYTAAGQALLKQFQSGQIRPDQQAVVNTAQQQGQALIDSTSGLGAIAQQAYKDYQAGKLQPAQEQQLADQAAAQKQELRQRLGPNVDSSTLAQMDAQIDNQTMETRQQLLDARFATGNTAYDQWLKGTREGQQLQLEGQQFASKALDQMLTQSLDLGVAGMQPVEQSIQLAIQSDTQLASEVSGLIGNLAAAYAYSAAGRGGGTTVNVGSRGGGGAYGGLGSALSGLGSIGKLIGPNGQPIDLGSANAGQLFGSTADQALGQNPAGSIDLSTTDLSGLGAGDLFGTSAGSALGDTTAGGIDLSGTDLSGLSTADMFGTGFDSSLPSGAGGQAAAPSISDVQQTSGGSGLMGSIFGGASNALGVASGIGKGGIEGDLSAGLSAASLAGKAGILPSGTSAGLAPVGAGLGLITGLEKGGVAGDVQAATSAAQLANQAGMLGSGASSALATALPIVGAGLFAYGTVAGELASETPEAQFAYDYSSNPGVISAAYRDYKAGFPVLKSANALLASRGQGPVESSGDYRDVRVR